MPFYGWEVNSTVLFHPHIPCNFEDLFNPCISFTFASGIFSGATPD